MQYEKDVYLQKTAELRTQPLSEMTELRRLQKQENTILFSE